MTLQELVEKVSKHIPNLIITEESNGEIVFCTGMKVDTDENLIPMEEN
jgi:hypothetical protein